MKSFLIQVSAVRPFCDNKFISVEIIHDYLICKREREKEREREREREREGRGEREDTKNSYFISRKLTIEIWTEVLMLLL